MEQEYYIYQLLCQSSGKSYIGQTQKYKYKNDRPYHYGVSGRWCDHVSSSKKSDTPLHQAIRECGLETFTQILLETVTEENADAREAYWISTLKTSVPDGYNVMVHSRCKHRKNSNVLKIYSDVKSVEVKHIQKDGIPRLVYVYVDTPSGRKRLTFGQSKTDTFDIAVQKANEVVEEYRKHGAIVLSSDKRTQFIGQQLKRIRIVPFHKTMVAIYITDSKNKETRICFGGKHITYQNALQQAKEFINGLQSDCVILKESATGDSLLG
jgi:group I intron endonuclease